ncbi:MAG: DUF362 domain-containing protein [Clostridiales bacterium]|jgi:uncharacterized protein (DUF362 family)/Pyruvate/2-oxoacid:ferredoxin oxidoreductase delta subunit|nr:DUF362 domain-containing protein [Eubacteriales bacterium]MDH7565170.1 DUF362 domain-containing protein [Clostridiales bacterium]
MSKVAVVRCESYEYPQVKSAVERGIHLLGGAGAFAKPGEKILLKPNLLAADSPEKCSTTHPAVFKAVGEVFKSTGAVLSYGDSPAVHTPRYAAKKAGIADAAREIGIELAEFEKGEERAFHGGVQNKRFIIAKGVVESEGIISLSKMKTHGFARMTGSIKNQFGCIPGTLKGEFHVKIPDVNEFARMLVDLNLLLKPRLFIMDGILAMEGNGPRSGIPRKMNVLLFSSDPVALDSTVCRMINLDPEYVPTIKFGQEAGLGTYRREEIEVVGDDFAGFYVGDFDVKREPVKPYKPGGVIQFLRNRLVPRPYINKEKCKKCGVCVSMCPVSPKAVDWHDGIKNTVPEHAYKRCIRCYCCQEMCPESAIELKVPLLKKVLKK